MVLTKRKLETLYRKYNRRERVHPDPVELLYAFDDPADREIATLVASSLAYGRVRLILKSASAVLRALDRPSRSLRRCTPARLRRAFSGFRHRFASGEHVAALLLGARRLIGEFGSLEACFLEGYEGDPPTTAPALQAFGARLCEASGDACGHLVPRPGSTSACKRMNLMLRWLVRSDAVDPGGWEGIPPSKLVVPLDVHMHRTARAFGLTKRAAADGRGIVLYPLSFVSEHSETLVELDMEYRHLAEQAGVAKYVRVPTVGTHPQFIHGLADLVRAALWSTRS